jgi:MFS family permease
MMAVALAAEAGAAGLFLTANGLGALYGGRILQGVATGVAASTVGAALLELQPAHRPALGATVNSSASTAALAAAALGASAVIQYGPAPTRLVFWLLLAASLAGLAVLALVPESGTRRPVPRNVLRPRAGVPRAARRAFAAALPALVASWALGGLYFSLGPSLAENLAHSADVVWGGLVIFLLAGFGSAASLLLRKRPAQGAMIAGGAVLAAGSAATVAAIATGSPAGFLAGSAVAGVGFGASFLGSFRHLAALASPAERGTLIATVYAVSYLAFSLPAIAAGVATTRLGLHETAIVYGAGVSALAALAAVASAMTRHAGSVPARGPASTTGICDRAAQRWPAPRPQ